MTPINCPRCGHDQFKKEGSILAPRGRVQRFVCLKCHKKFHLSLATQPIAQVEGFLDIEASQLVASFGHMISWAIKKRKGRITSDILRNRSLAEEKRLLQSLLEELKKYDLIYTYYGTGFDIPFIRTRCLYHGLEFPEYLSIFHRDVYYMARGRLSLHSKRLAVVSEFLGIKGKTRVDPAIWVAADMGNAEEMARALTYILRHNREDVRVLERVYDVMEPFVKPTNRSV